MAPALNAKLARGFPAGSARQMAQHFGQPVGGNFFSKQKHDLICQRGPLGEI